MAKAQSTYMGMFFLKIPVIQLMLASGTYLALSIGLGKKDILDAKFEFLHTWDLGYVCERALSHQHRTAATRPCRSPAQPS
eukprot:COSAG06_NODE_244_length_19215_cov_20.256853_4_plen_81_part_00